MRHWRTLYFIDFSLINEARFHSPHRVGAGERVHAHKCASAWPGEDVLALARLRQTATGQYLRRPPRVDVRWVRGR